MWAFCGIAVSVQAQYVAYSVGGGIMRYRGDLSWKGSMVYPTFFAAYHKNMSSHFSWGLRGYWGTLGADDRVDSPTRWRGLNFSSPVMGVEWELVFNFRKFLLDVRSASGTFFTVGGVSAFYYSPVAEYEGRRYPLGGMFLEKDRRLKSGVAIAIPLGVGFKQMLGDRFFIQTTLRAYPTFSDYLDGASGHYPKWMDNPDSQVVSLSNRSIYSPEEVSGKLRANPQNKDWFFTWTVSLYYVVLRSVCVVF